MFLSIMGMYDYDASIFDGLDIPTYTTENGETIIIDKNTVINNIILKCAELEVIYPEFDTMKLAIGVWSAANQNTWKKLINTQFINYNPIWNVDANIEDSENRSRSATHTDSRDITRTENNNNKETRNLTDTEKPNETNTHSVAGFNTTSWADASKDVRTGTNTLEHTGTDIFDGKLNSQIDDDLTHNEQGSEELVHTTRRTGNIGVTTTQAMLQEERKIAEFNIIDYIAESFKHRFCLMIY